MKFQSDGKEEYILISLNKFKFAYQLKFIKKYNNILLYNIDSAKVYNELMSLKNAFSYLDRFVLLLPGKYTDQKKLWGDFYQLFGEKYEELTDKERNISCIETMLKYIDEKKQGDMLKILDFGCGSGFSLLVRSSHDIIGYEPVEIMKCQAQKKGLTVFDKDNLRLIPNNYFDAVFSSYVLHMGIQKQDIKQIIPKLKKDAIWVANFYKGINEYYVNNLFIKLGFDINSIIENSERYGHMYEYSRK